jgi:outer membrane protein assembly factor BamA
MKCVLAALSLAVASIAAAQDPPTAAQPQPVLRELRLEGVSIFTSDDVLWLLRLREGSPLPDAPEAVAKSLQERYERDGYTEARVGAAFDAGRLTLTADEGRIDEVQILGVDDDVAARLRLRLQIKPGDIYNRRIVGRAAGRIVAESQGAFEIGHPSRNQPGFRRGEAAPDEVILERRGTRNVLVVPLRWNASRVDTSLGSGREDLYSPVDGVSPALAISSTIFDHATFNHTHLNGYVSYKFGRDDPGYSAGIERPIFGGPRLFLGGEIHDVTASDDLWRVSTLEQTLVAIGFKNSFRDYYRRRGRQLFAVFRPGSHNELSAMARWDRHEPLGNATAYSFFRDDASFRPSQAVADQRVNALVFGYTFDTRPLTSAGRRETYQRHLKDNLFGMALHRRPGVRLEWTSEVAGRGMKGDADFDRHILNARGYLAMGPRSLLSGRALLGFSNGTLPVERRFAIGGIGSVRGYAFKESSGTGMTLLNVEYSVTLDGSGARRNGGVVLSAFYDAGRVTGSFDPGAASRWLNGVGFGIGAGGVRVEFGFRADDIPKSRQILLRLSPTF